MTKKVSIQQLLKRKKQLLKSPEINQEIQKELDDIEHQIDQRINRNDQNFFRTFYRTAKEQLTGESFNTVEGIASTRVNDYQKKNAANKDSISFDIHIPIRSN